VVALVNMGASDGHILASEVSVFTEGYPRVELAIRARSAHQQAAMVHNLRSPNADANLQKELDARSFDGVATVSQSSITVEDGLPADDIGTVPEDAADGGPSSYLLVLSCSTLGLSLALFCAVLYIRSTIGRKEFVYSQQDEEGGQEQQQQAEGGEVEAEWGRELGREWAESRKGEWGSSLVHTNPMQHEEQQNPLGTELSIDLNSNQTATV
jgi:hypothetical protein